MKVNKTLFILLSSFFINCAFAQQAEPQWFKYFGYAAETAGFAVASSRFFYEAYLGYQHSKIILNPNVPTVSTVDIPLIKNVSELMGLDPETKIIFSQHSGASDSPVTAGINSLYLTPNLLLFPVEEQKYLLGHEASHVKNNDTRNKCIIAALVPFVSYGVLKAYDIYSQRFITHLELKLNNSKISKCLGVVRIVNKVVATSPITQYLLSLYITSKCSQYRELRADHESVITLNVAKAGIDAFKRFRSTEYAGVRSVKELINYVNKLPPLMRLYAESKTFDPILGMREHPSDEVRIAALEKLIAK